MTTQVAETQKMLTTRKRTDKLDHIEIKNYLSEAIKSMKKSKPESERRYL